MNTGHRAFSLVEVLIVTAILSLLAAILFVTSEPSREASRQRVCTSNLHQLGLAVALYRADYDGADAIVGQPMQYWQLGLPSARNFPDFTKTYVKSRQVLLCPDYNGSTPIDRVTSNYAWLPNDGTYLPPYAQFSKIVARRGDDTLIMTDTLHNPPYDLSKVPRWTLKRIIFLRLSGQVQTKQVPVKDYEDADL